MSLKATLAELKNCTHCEAQLPCGAKPIFQISSKAKILIASQAPGIRAHDIGLPFYDPSGVRLRKWFNVDEEQFYNPDNFLIIPMGFCYPGTGERYDNPPRSECTPLWRERLLTQLPNIELILPIGNYAQKWHLKGQMHKNMTETVRHWQDYWPNTLPMPHPSPRNNIWFKKNPWFEAEVIPVLQKRIATLI